jgi:uncharacterized protein YktA (UPF0223 family)
MAMMERIGEVHENQLKALEEIEKEKRRVIRAYNKKVKKKSFQVGELVWKTILPFEKEKRRVIRAYNKKVKKKSFQVGELVWKTILSLGTQSNKYGKWSPTWEGPNKVVGMVPGGAYFVETLEGRRLSKALNGKYLKQYHPSVWQEAYRKGR